MDSRSRWFTVPGPVRAWRAGTELDVGSAQQRAVLATLLLRRGTPVSVEDVIDALWDRDVPSAAAGTVRTHISRLRQVLGGDAVADPVIRSAGPARAAARCGRSGPSRPGPRPRGIGKPAG